MSLRWRLTMLYTGLLAGLLCIIMLTVLGVLRSNLYTNVRDDIEQSLKQVVLTKNVVSRGVSLGLSTQDVVYPDIYYQLDLYPFQDADSARKLQGTSLMPELTGVERSDALRSEDPNQNNLIRLEQADYARLMQSPEGKIYVQTTLKIDQSNHTLMVLVALATARNIAGFPSSAAVVYLAKDLHPLQEIMERLQLIMLVVSLGAIVGMGIGSYMLAGRALKPLRQVREAAAQISEKTLKQRVPEPNTGDEVASLAHTLNRMLSRLDRSFEMQRRFTSDASHELRTPVTAIGGHASYLIRRTQLNEQQSESLHIIKNESERLSKLISSLLELARADSGSFPLQPSLLIADMLLSNIAREMAPIAEHAEIKIDAELNLAFEADAHKLRQVFINLVGNALKAGSSLVILKAKAETRQIHFEIIDNGPGIGQEHLGKLFERFYRVEESRSRDVGGSGLGLAIVKTIVDAHSGSIWFESELGKGTTVHITLPMSEPEPVEPEVKRSLITPIRITR